MIEYGDFECPSCIRAYPAVALLQRHFHGRVCFAYRHFPLTDVHPHAELAAEAAEAAAGQGRFWPFHNRLFEHPGTLTPHALREHAREVGLDLERYDAEMRDRIYLQRIHEQHDGGARSGVRGTPSFFVNGVLADVSFGASRLMETIDAALR